MSLIYVTVVVTLMAGFCSIGVDWGRVQLVKTQLYRTADAAARAAMTEMQSGNGVSLARTAAVTVAGQNTADGSGVVITNADVTFGTYDDTTDTFTTLTGSAEANANAVRVICSRTAAKGNAVQLVFGKLLGGTNGSCDVNTDCVIKFDQTSRYNLVGINSLTIDNCDIDSYDSSVGPYGTGNKRGNAALASQGTITLKNSSHIHSEAHPGIGYSIVKDWGSEINATTPFNSGSDYPIQTPATASITSALYYPVDYPGTYATSNDNNQVSSYVDGSGNFSYTGNHTVNMPAGTYCFNTFTLGGHGTLNCTGPVTIYVASTVFIDGTVKTYQTNTHNFVMKVYGSGTVTLNFNGSGMYGSIYAPLSNVSEDGGGAGAGFYGAIIGKTLYLASDKLHYDESLADDNLGGPSKKQKHHKKPKNYN